MRLDALKSVGSDFGPVERNLFRFRVAAVQAPQPGGAVPRPAAPVVAAGPVGPVPITMKFIGVVEESVAALRIAVLSDTRGVYEGREGDVIEGRYRIVRIGEESIEMSYVDGRGRQTIRLSGS